MFSYDFNQTQEWITLHTPELELAWSCEDGALRMLRFHNSASVLGHGAPQISLDIALGKPEAWLTQRSFARYLSHHYDMQNGLATVVIVVGLGPLKLYDQYVVCGTLISRQIRIENVSLDERRIYGLRMLAPNARVGRAETCFFEAPGNSVRPHVPFAVAAAHRPGVLPRQFFAPDLYEGQALELSPVQGSGLLALHNAPAPGRNENETLLCWYSSSTEVAFPYIEGIADNPAATAVSLGHDIRLAGWLPPEATLSSGTQYLALLREDWSQALTTIRDTLPLRKTHPTEEQAAWLRDATIYETHPALFGGFRRMIEVLPHLIDLGITTLLLLPMWEFAHRRTRLWDGNWIDSGNPYAVRDFEALDPMLGVSDDLRALVEAAHAQGLHVLFDFVVHGCAAESRHVEEHPEWFAKDETGAFITPMLPGAALNFQDCYSFDSNNPDLRAYLYNWALAHMQRYNIDGYRVVTPCNIVYNWSRRLPSNASAGTLGWLPLLQQLRRDLRRIKADAALVCNLSGPIYVASHDAAYDYLVHNMFVHTALNRMTPAELGAYLYSHFATLPPRSVRIGFTETHDTCDVNPLVGGLRGARISRLILAGMIFCGFVPALWSGQEQGEERVIRALFRVWREYPVLRYGQAWYNAVQCDSAQVFAVLRSFAGVHVLGLLNFGAHKRTVTLRMPADALGLAQQHYRLRELVMDLIWSEEDQSSWERDELQHIQLTLEPFGAYCVAIEADTTRPEAAYDTLRAKERREESIVAQ
jgi:hypothetical protein